MAFPEGWGLYKTGVIKRATGALEDWQARLVVAEGTLPSPVSGRYVKVTIASNWGNSLCAMTTLWVCGANGYKLNHENMTHTASSTLNGAAKNCSNTVETTGDYWQFYISNAPVTWVVDLGASKTIYSFQSRVLTSNQDRNMKDFTIHVSDNGSDWTLVLDAQTANSTARQVFQIAADISLEAHGKTDLGDLRFSDADDIPLNYCIDHITGTTPNQIAYVDVKIADIADTDTTIKCWYGNSEAASESSAANTYIVGDQFERGNDGDAVGGAWTVVTGTCEIDTAQKYAGTRSLRMVGGAAVSQAFVGLSAAEDISIQMHVRKTTGAGNFAPIMHGNGTKHISLFFTTSEDLKYYYGNWSTADTGVNCAVDTWESLEIRNINWTAYTYDIYFKGALAKSGATMVDIAGYTNELRVYNAVTTSGNDAWIDNLIVRKWLATPPEWQGAWSEEQENSGDDAEATFALSANGSIIPLGLKTGFGDSEISGNGTLVVWGFPPFTSLAFSGGGSCQVFGAKQGFGSLDLSTNGDLVILYLVNIAQFIRIFGSLAPVKYSGTLEWNWLSGTLQLNDREIKWTR